MARYMYIFRGGAFVTGGLSPTEMQEHLAKWYRWADRMGKAGGQQIGRPLENRGKTVRGRERSFTDGPYAESKDLVTGSLVFEAASLEEAAELAKDCPIFEFDGSVEVRPVLEQDD
jgi:hypothetical protein